MKVIKRTHAQPDEDDGDALGVSHTVPRVEYSAYNTMSHTIFKDEMHHMDELAKTNPDKA